jgi:polyketide biosynthesis enoyl-CoA hydratase PksH
MRFETLLIKESPRVRTIRFHRPEAKNSINRLLLAELNLALDEAERDPQCRVVVLEGDSGLFCTGLDFSDAVTSAASSGEDIRDGEYMRTLRRFSLTSRIVIAKVDGQVVAGGLGFVAASDLAVATPRSVFSLPEALWGLLPANVLPYLIRRVGFQKAYMMSLTTQKISAAEAEAMSLIDKVADDPDDFIRRSLLRFVRLDEETVVELKAYFRRMWIITEEMEGAAVKELARLLGKPKVRENLANFVEQSQFPWENRS